MKSRIICLSLFSFIHTFTYATVNPGANCAPTTVGFFNGMLNDLNQASRNFAQIQVEMYNTQDYYSRISLPLYYVLFFNKTQGIYSDLNAAFNQLKKEEDGRTKLSTRTQLDQENHEALADRAIKANHGLMLIGHSQGNFFLNHIYEYCQRNSSRPKDRRCGAIQIGSPTNKQYGQQFLSEKDLIIKGFFALTGRKFETGLKSPFNPNDPTGHGLINTYLSKELPPMSPRAPIIYGFNYYTWKFCSHQAPYVLP